MRNMGIEREMSAERFEILSIAYPLLPLPWRRGVRHAFDAAGLSNRISRSCFL